MNEVQQLNLHIVLHHCKKPVNFDDMYSFCLCLFQACGHIENEIAKWQKEINQTEQQWLRKMQQSGSLESTEAQHGCAGKQPVRSGQKADPQTAKIDVEEWRNSSYTAPSECSNVSSDLDLDADVPVVLPSVKELARHFSGGTTSDSDSSVAKVSVSCQDKQIHIPGKQCGL